MRGTSLFWLHTLHPPYVIFCRSCSLLSPFRLLRYYVDTEIQPCIIDGAFVKIINRQWLLTIFAKRSILGVWQGSEYAVIIIKTSFRYIHLIKTLRRLIT